MSARLATSRLKIRGPGLILLAMAALSPSLAHAYVGPGLGLGAVSSFFTLIGAIFLGIVGFIWYPIKRLLRMLRSRSSGAES